MRAVMASGGAFLQRGVAAIAALATLLAAGATRAQERVPYQAELADTAKRDVAKAGGVEWSCAGTRCTTEARGGNVTVRGCSELARAVGTVVRYRSEVKSLGQAEIAECNRLAGAPAAKAPAAAKAATPSGPRVITRELTYTGVWPPGARQ